MCGGGGREGGKKGEMEGESGREREIGREGVREGEAGRGMEGGKWREGGR